MILPESFDFEASGKYTQRPEHWIAAKLEHSAYESVVVHVLHNTPSAAVSLYT